LVASSIGDSPSWLRLGWSPVSSLGDRLRQLWPRRSVLGALLLGTGGGYLWGRAGDDVLSSVVAPEGPSGPVAKAEGKTHQITLVASQVADNFTYNGTVPGPTIEIVEGDTVELTLVNELDVDASVHVHGVHYDITSDGTRHSKSFAPPGGRYTYRWFAAAGTAGYWHYHDHVINRPEQPPETREHEGSGGIDRGLYGAVIVRRPGEALPDKTFVIVMIENTLNGLRFPNAPFLEAREGERVEFVIIGHGDFFHTFHLHGHRWVDPGTFRLLDTKTVGPAESFGFQVIAGEGVGPGDWMYHCHVHDHMDMGMFGFFHVMPK